MFLLLLRQLLGWSHQINMPIYACSTHPAANNNTLHKEVLLPFPPELPADARSFVRFVLFAATTWAHTHTYTVHTPTLQLLLRKLPKCYRHILSSHTQQQLRNFLCLPTELQCQRWHCSNLVSNHADSNKSKWLPLLAPVHTQTHTQLCGMQTVWPAAATATTTTTVPKLQGFTRVWNALADHLHV